MNKCIIKSYDLETVLSEKEYSRMSSQEDGLAITFKDGYDSTLRHLEKNRIYRIEVTANDVAVFTGDVLFVSYNFLMTISDSESMVVVDNTVLFSIVD